jgi:hypothetical protein
MKLGKESSIVKYVGKLVLRRTSLFLIEHRILHMQNDSL